jgi:enoyl-CoA hydratase/carnithine racemase
LIQRVFKSDAFETELSALAHALAANAPLSMRASKQALRTMQEPQPSSEAFYQDMADCLNSEDTREALAAFKEKRSPVFKGR